MLRGYWDDSGHSSDSDSVSVAGCIACLSRWNALEEPWKAALVEFGLTEFKMSAFANECGQFIGWSVEKREACLTRFLGLMESNIEAYAGASDFKIQVHDALKNKKPDSYHVCLQNTLNAADSAVEEFWSPIEETIQMFFDEQGEFYEEVHRWFRALDESGVDMCKRIHIRGVNGITFVKSHLVVQVQSADIVAYELNQQILMQTGKPHKSNNRVWSLIQSKPNRFLGLSQ